MSHASAAHPTKVVVLQVSGVYLSTSLRTANISYTIPERHWQSSPTTPHTVFELSITAPTLAPTRHLFQFLILVRIAHTSAEE